ncbi:MAG: serine hydrolase domain-containing protein [Pseudomonadota bacterium]
MGSLNISRLMFGSAYAALLAACQVAAPPQPVSLLTETAAQDATSIAREELIAPKTIAFTEAGVAALEARMVQYVADGNIYGIATRLVQGGEIISDYKTGVMRLEAQTPIADDTIYRIYSMTKPMTGVAMMMLWEKGAFSLDDPVTEYVPEFEGLRVMDGINEDGTPILVDLTRPPTMRELMSHTAGFAYGLRGDDPANRAFREREILRARDLETFIGRVAEVPLLFQPGEAWSYSAAVDIQGYIIEKISGQSFGDFLQAQMFEPLGMVDTAFAVTPEKYGRFSEVYGRDPESGALVPVPFPEVQFTPETVAFESGGGGLTSTMNDYARFCQMLLNGGELDGIRILKPETIELMRTNVLTDGIMLSSDGANQGDTRPGIGFGLDLGIITDAEAVGQPYGEGTYFWGGAAGTWFWIDPENDLYFIGMIQTFDREGPIGDIRAVSADLVYAAMADETVAVVP